MINWFVAVGLFVKLFTIITLSFYVVPKQIKELQRPARDMIVVIVRWVLFSGVMLYNLANIIPLAYQLTRLNDEPIFNLQNSSSLSSNIGSLAITATVVAVYYLAGVLSKRNDRV